MDKGSDWADRGGRGADLRPTIPPLVDLVVAAVVCGIDVVTSLRAHLSHMCWVRGGWSTVGLAVRDTSEPGVEGV